MDLQSLSLPDWLPWWAVIALLVPMAFYLALFLLMPFSTFGLRARLRDMELRIDALHEDIRALTLRLPERGGSRHDDALLRQPPIPPAMRESGPREGHRGLEPREASRALEPREEPTREPASRGSLGDPVADRMLAYMRDKAQSGLQRGEPRAPRPRTEQRAEPRLAPSGAAEPPVREPQGPPSPIATPLPPPFPLDGPPAPLPPRVPNRFGRRPPDGDTDDSRADWPR
jgi:hypothetical protein